MRRRLTRADVLAEMVRAVNASLEPERVADAMVARVSDWIPAPGWLVAGQRRGRRAPHRHYPRPAGRARGVCPGRRRARRCARGQPFCSADIAADRRLAAGRKPARPAAAIGFPLECRGRTVGALVGIDRAPSAREPQVRRRHAWRRLRAALEPGAIALDNALRMQRAEALSVTDDLTQLYNSRYLSQVLRRETKRASRSGRPLSLLFIDLDGFKGVNDTHGHLAGSARWSRRRRSSASAPARPTSSPGSAATSSRWCCPTPAARAPRSVGERIRDKIAAHPFLQKDGLDIRLTVSVGVATLPDVAASAEQLIQAADEAMYWVKEHGKNNVHVAGS